MRIFITGASGFIGQHLSPLLQKYHEVKHMQSMLEQYDSVKQELDEFSPEIVIHLAALTEVEHSFYQQVAFSTVNYVGTVNLIECCKDLPNLKKFVFASTMEVYGWSPASDVIKNAEDTLSLNQLFENPTDAVFTEETTPHPNAPYAVAKFGCEKYLEYANRAFGFPYVIIRQTNSYGRVDNNFFVTEQIIYQMLTNKNEIKLGYKKPFRNFLHVNDLISAWHTIVESDITNELFCLGPNNAVRISSYVDIIAEKINWQGTVNWDTKPPRPGEIYLLNSSNDKLTAATGWAPVIDLDVGLDLTIAAWNNILSDDLPFKGKPQ